MNSSGNLNIRLNWRRGIALGGFNECLIPAEQGAVFK